MGSGSRKRLAFYQPWPLHATPEIRPSTSLAEAPPAGCPCRAGDLHGVARPPKSRSAVAAQRPPLRGSGAVGGRRQPQPTCTHDIPPLGTAQAEQMLPPDANSSRAAEPPTRRDARCRLAHCLLISTRRASALSVATPTSTNSGGFMSTFDSGTPAAFSASRTAAARFLASSSFFAVSPVLSV